MEETKRVDDNEKPKFNYRGLKAMPFIIGNKYFFSFYLNLIVFSMVN